MATRLTPTQKEFLLSLYDPYEDDTYAECFRHEARTAWSLYNRGLVEFAEGNELHHLGCDYFEARLTDSGWTEVEKLRRNT